MIHKLKIGLFGGSFNPPHAGHFYISSLALKKFNLNKILWIVTGRNPFKKKLFFFPLKTRIALSNKLIGKNRKMSALDFESDLPSFQTFYTIKKAIRAFPLAKLYWITGSDALFSFHKWKRYDFILQNTRLLVFARQNALKSVKTRIFIKYKNNIEFIWGKRLNISSTSVRKEIFWKKRYFFFFIIRMIIYIAAFI